MVIVIVRGTLEVPEMIRKMFKEKFPGLVGEIIFNKELDDFLKIQSGEGIIVFGNNPFNVENYPLLVEPENFKTWVYDRVKEINTESDINFFFSSILNERELYKNHVEEFIQMFNSLNLLKTQLANRPGPSSFIPSSATESIFLERE